MAKNVVGLDDNNVLRSDYVYDIIQSKSQAEVNESQISINTDIQNSLAGKLDISYLEPWVDSTSSLPLKILSIMCDSSSGGTITITVTGGYCNIQMLVFTRYGISCLYASCGSTASLDSVKVTTLSNNAGYTASVSGANLIIKTSSWTNFYALAYVHTLAKITWTYS